MLSFIASCQIHLDLPVKEDVGRATCRVEGKASGDRRTHSQAFKLISKLEHNRLDVTRKSNWVHLYYNDKEYSSIREPLPMSSYKYKSQIFEFSACGFTEY